MLFTDAKEHSVFQPILGLKGRDLIGGVERVVNPLLIPERLVRDALRHLLDLLVLPPRQDAIDLIDEVRATLLDPRSTPATIAAALVKVIENSREVALVPAITADLIRHAPSSYPKESIGMKLWKRWTPVIQGTVGLQTFLAPRGSERIT